MKQPSSHTTCFEVYDVVTLTTSPAAWGAGDDQVGTDCAGDDDDFDNAPTMTIPFFSRRTIAVCFRGFSRFRLKLDAARDVHGKVFLVLYLRPKRMNEYWQLSAWTHGVSEPALRSLQGSAHPRPFHDA